MVETGDRGVRGRRGGSWWWGACVLRRPFFLVSGQLVSTLIVVL